MTLSTDKPKLIDVFAKGSNEMTELLGAVSAKCEGSFLLSITEAYGIGNHIPRSKYVLNVLFYSVSILVFFILSFLMITAFNIEYPWNVVSCSFFALAVFGSLNGGIHKLWSRYYILLSPKTLVLYCGLRWKKNVIFINRSEIQSIGLFKVMKMRKQRKRSYYYQESWSFNITLLSGKTEKIITQRHLGISSWSLEDEYEAYVWIGNRLAEWAGVQFVNEEK